jgi:regulator of protease activity HflC (stomatin/prohibitin superfamily)
MTWIIFTIIFGIAGIALLVIAGRAARADSKRNQVPGSIFVLASAAVALIWVILTLFSIFHKVDNGHVGLVYTFGEITGQRGDGHGGLVVTFPWQSVDQANVQVQALQPITDCNGGQYKACMVGFTKETQDVFVTATINIHINPQNIQTLYRSIGPDYVNKLVLPRIAQVTKEETVKYAAVDIAPNREQLRKTISQRLTTELSAHSIIVDDFLLTNVEFKDEFKASIEAKVKAEQDAQAEQNKVEIAKAQAAQVAATAQGQADKLRIEAEGQAAANKLISESLTPELIQFQAIQKLAPNISVVGIPIGQGTIFDVGSLLTPNK